MTKRKKNNESAKVWKDEWKNKWMNEWISLYIRWFPNYPCFIHILQLIIEIWSSPLDGGYIKIIKIPPSPALSLPLPSLNYTIKLILKNVGKVILIIFFAYSDGCTQGDGIEGI